MSTPTHVTIREVALRDGLQIEPPIPLSAKLDMLAAIAATGVREVEAADGIDALEALQFGGGVPAELAAAAAALVDRYWGAGEAAMEEEEEEGMQAQAG